jgi:DNA repair exonuclease SbcCD nuclease subunit
LQILIVGDLHIPNSKVVISNSDTFTEVFNTLNLIKNTIEENKPEYTIFMGDIFDSPYNISISVLSSVSNIIADMALETKLIFIVGNHDMSSINEDTIKISDGNSFKYRANLLSPYRHYPNVLVVDKPSVFSIDKTNIELAFIPYSNDINKDLDSIKNKFGVGTKRICLGHFNMRSGLMMMSDNADINENLPTPEEMVDKYNYDMVLLGHIHDKSEFYIKGKLLKYVGSCRNVDFRNADEDKGIYLMNTDNMSLQYVDNPYTYIYKIFHGYEEFEKYCETCDNEKLARMKVRYIYTDTTDVKEMSKLKHCFKSLSFQKGMLDGDKMNSTVSAEAFKEFENLVSTSLVTKDKLVDYALQFKKPDNVDIAMEVMNIANKM